MFWEFEATLAYEFASNGDCFEADNINIDKEFTIALFTISGYFLPHLDWLIVCFWVHIEDPRCSHWIIATASENAKALSLANSTTISVRQITGVQTICCRAFQET